MQGDIKMKWSFYIPLLCLLFVVGFFPWTTNAGLVGGGVGMDEASPLAEGMVCTFSAPVHADLSDVSGDDPADKIPFQFLTQSCTQQTVWLAGYKDWASESYLGLSPSADPTDVEGSAACLLEGNCDTGLPVGSYLSSPHMPPTFSQDRGNLSLGLGILITMLSLAFVGFIFNRISTKRPWR